METHNLYLQPERIHYGIASGRCRASREFGMCCMIILTHNNDRRLFNGRAVVGRLLQSSPSQNYLLLIPTLPTNTPSYTLLWKHSIFSLLCTLVASIHSFLPDSDYLVLISPHNSILLAKVYLSPHRRQCVSSPPSPL